MLDFAGVGPGDVVYDLGCGDGRIVIEAARRGAHAVGIDNDLLRVRESYENCRRSCMTHRARFRRASFFDVDLRDATVVTLYLLPAVNVRLRPKLLWELRPGARVIANYYEIGDWQPDAEATAHHRHLMKWIIPAWVGGVWHAVLRDADGRRRHMRLDLHRRYQHVWGTARLGGPEPLALSGARLVGDQLSFTLYHPRRLRPPLRFTARLAGPHLRGTFDTPAPASPAASGVWGAARASKPGAG
jgi:SAM-dependent methyltransferase